MSNQWKQANVFTFRLSCTTTKMHCWGCRHLGGYLLWKPLFRNLFNSSESTSIDLFQTWNLTPNCQDTWPDFWPSLHCRLHRREARAWHFYSVLGSILHHFAVCGVNGCVCCRGMWNHSCSLDDRSRVVSTPVGPGSTLQALHLAPKYTKDWNLLFVTLYPADVQPATKSAVILSA